MNIVDLPSGGTGSGENAYDNLPIFRQESRVTILVDDVPATVYGGVTRGDGLGGFYFFDAASLLADNDVSVIKPNSIAVGSPGRWIKWLG